MPDKIKHVLVLKGEGDVSRAVVEGVLDSIDLDDFSIVAGNSIDVLVTVMTAIGVSKDVMQQELVVSSENAVTTVDNFSERINDRIKQRLEELQDVVDTLGSINDQGTNDPNMFAKNNHTEIDNQAIANDLIADRKAFKVRVTTLKRILDELKQHPDAYSFATHAKLMQGLKDLHINPKMKDILLTTAELEPIFSSLDDPPRFADMNALSMAKAAAIVAFPNGISPIETNSPQGADGEFAAYEAVAGSVQTDAINRIDPTSQFAVNDPTDLVLEHLESTRDSETKVLSLRLASVAPELDRRVRFNTTNLGARDLNAHEKRKIDRLERNRHRILEIDVQTSTARTVATKMASWQVMKEQRRDQDSASEKDTVNHLDERKILMKRRTAEAWRKQIKKHRKKKHRKKGSSSTSFSSSRRLFSPSDGQQEEHELSGTSIKK